MKKVTTLAIKADVCNIPCFDHDKVEQIKATLAAEEQNLPELAEFYKLLGNTTRLKILLATGIEHGGHLPSVEAVARPGLVA